MRIYLFGIILIIVCYPLQAQAASETDSKLSVGRQQNQLQALEAASPLNSAEQIYQRRGIVIAKKRVRINSRIDAAISKLYVEEGTRFKKNDLLVTFDCSVERAALEEARLAHEVAKFDFEAKKHAAEETPLSPQSLELLKLKTKLAFTKLNRLREHIKYCRLFAPFAGRVLRIPVQEHETATASAPLIEIIDDQPLHFRVFLPWIWLNRLSVGDSAEIEVMGKNYPAELVELSEEVDPLDQSIKALLKFRSEDGLKIGMNGVVKFTENRKNDE